METPQNGHSQISIRPARQLVVQMGLFTIERNSVGRYFVSVPDGAAEVGLSLKDLYDLYHSVQQAWEKELRNFGTE